MVSFMPETVLFNARTALLRSWQKKSPFDLVAERRTVKFEILQN